MNTTHDNHDDIGGGDASLLAAEYVLGLLDPNTQRTAHARLDSDPAFAREVANWQAHFSPWLEAIDPVPVPEQVWQRIRNTLEQAEPVAARPTPATATARPSLWERLPFWRGLAAGGFAVALASLSALFVTARRMPLEAPPAPPQVVTITPAPVASMVASIRHDDGSAAYSATIDPATGVITLIPAFMPDDVRVPELWVIQADGVPHSLGVVARDHAMRVTIPAALREAAAAGSILAVTLEPEGGSPTGKPTGPAIAKGSLISL